MAEFASAAVEKRALIISDRSSDEEKRRRHRMIELLNERPIPDSELIDNLSLYFSRKALARLLFIEEIYKKIIDVHGIIVEFGVRWGRDLAVFEALRGTFEPFNYTRRIVGFDTFDGFPAVSREDGADAITKPGHFAVSPGYERYLEEIMACHAQENPIPHLKKYEIIKGDASVAIHEYLGKHPETIVSLAYFDMDLYKPTRDCLEAIRERLTKGSVIAFDELNHERFPGETVAVIEVLGLGRFPLRRTPFMPTASYAIVG
jgi:hypothetical protein